MATGKESEAGKWSSVGSALYRKLELYSLQWLDSNNSTTLQLDRCKKVVCAPFGGPIALWREMTAAESSNRSTAASRSQIDTYTAAGQRLGTAKRNTDNLLDIGWSYDEHLFSVYLDGRISVDDMYGSCLKSTSFGSEVDQAGVAECRFFVNYKNNSGIIVLTNTAKFHVITNINNPQTLHVNTESALSLAVRPSCWCFVPSTRGVEHALIAASEENVYRFEISTGTSRQVALPWDRPSPLRDIVPSPDRSRLAFLTASYGIIMTTADMKQVLCIFDKHKYKSPPRQFVWCGNSAVAAYWHDHKLLQLVAPPPETHATTPDLSSSSQQTPKCSTLVYKFNTTQYLCTEMDGLRSVSQFQHEFIQQVPQALADLFRYGTKAPSSTLLEAYSAFEERHHQADEYLRMVMDKLEDAVNACIQAAPYADEATQQKRILRTAAFGKAFIDEPAPTRDFYRMCQMLRVLNEVRSPLRSGMPLSYDQLEALTPTVLVNRLVARRQFPLAIEIANFLELPPDRGSSNVLINWALYKVRQQTVPNEQVAAAIIDKLSDVPGVSFFDVAECALRAGRNDVAGRLLEHEPNPYKQVKLLLQLERSDLAIRKAMESLDPALMYEVVLHMKHAKSMRQVDFYLNLTRNYPMACLVYKTVLQEHDAGRRELLLKDDAINAPKTTTKASKSSIAKVLDSPGVELRDCYSQDDSHYLEALCHVRDAYTSSADIQERQSELQQASAALTRARRHETLRVLCDDQRRLWKDQRGLEEKLNKFAFVDLSLHDTLRALIKQKQYKLADDMKKDYHVADRVYWYVKIDELASSADWEEFERFYTKSSKTTPLEDGYLPFFDACLKYGHRTQAAKLLTKLSDEQRIDAYIKLGQLEQAAEFARQKKDIRGLEIVLEQCPRTDMVLAPKIIDYLRELGR